MERSKAQQSQAAKKQPNKDGNRLSTVEEKLKSKLGADGLRWLEEFVEHEVAKEVAEELGKMRKHYVRRRL